MSTAYQNAPHHIHNTEIFPLTDSILLGRDFFLTTHSTQISDGDKIWGRTITILFCCKVLNPTKLKCPNRKSQNQATSLFLVKKNDCCILLRYIGNILLGVILTWEIKPELFNLGSTKNHFNYNLIPFLFQLIETQKKTDFNSGI